MDELQSKGKRLACWSQVGEDRMPSLHGETARPVEAQQSPVLGAEQNFALDTGLDPRGGQEKDQP